MKLLHLALLAACAVAEAVTDANNSTIAGDSAQEDRSSGACYPNVCGWQVVNGICMSLLPAWPCLLELPP